MPEKIKPNFAVITLLFFVFFAISSLSVSAEPLTYGTTLKETSATFKAEGKYFVSLGAGLENSNVQHDVNNLQLKVKRNFLDIFELGLTYKKFFVQNSQTTETLNEAIRPEGYSFIAFVPSDAAYLELGLLLLHGELNLLQFKQVSYYLGLATGPGIRRMESNQDFYGAFWSIESRLFFSKSMALSLEFTQEQQSLFDGYENYVFNQINLSTQFYF